MCNVIYTNIFFNTYQNYNFKTHDFFYTARKASASRCEYINRKNNSNFYTCSAIYIASSMTLLFLKRSCIIAVHNPGNANDKKQISLSSMITSNFDTDKDY